MGSRRRPGRCGSGMSRWRNSKSKQSKDSLKLRNGRILDRSGVSDEAPKTLTSADLDRVAEVGWRWTILAQPSLQRKTAFRRLPPVRRADPEGPLKVDMIRSASRR